MCLSTHGRLACVQEVRARLDLDQDRTVFEERPRDGVFDKVLLARFQTIIAALIDEGIEHFDMGMLDKRPLGCDDVDYEETFGAPSTYLNWLFFPQPVTTTRTLLLPAA